MGIKVKVKVKWLLKLEAVVFDWSSFSTWLLLHVFL